jgi:N-acyl-D-aspartate/D-glutamate deacylase
MGLARNSDLFAAGVDIHGVHDWSLRISTAPWIDYSDREAARIARESSPMGSVEKWRSPVLLIHGDDDRNVAFAQTVDLGQRLREQKVYFEQIVFPDEVHDFLLHSHWLQVYHAAFDFFEKFLKNGKGNAQVSKVDLLLGGGQVVDGSGADARVADVGISGDRIVFIGDAKAAGITATRTIDMTGLVVAPGFIDPHTHTAEDLSNPARKSVEGYLFQGVTTVVTGNDGGGPFPIGETLAKWQQQGIGVNAALFVGQGTVRRLVMGMSDAAPTPEQLERMRSLVAQGMDEGAIGMSTGLYYAPGSFAKTEEVIELAKIAGARGGVYDTHMRDESSYSIGLLGSIEETIRIGREARMPVQISHIKALGTDVWGQSKEAIAIIEKARREGVEITANQYPYTASGTSLTASLVPRWAEVGGNSELLKRIDDPAIRPRLSAEMEANLKRRGGPDSLLITAHRDRTLVGKRLGAIAKQRNQTPIEAALAIIKAGGASIASFNMNEDDIANFMRQPWVATGSDGSAGHPRKYGTYPRKLREYVYDKKIITLPFAIRASSALAAETLRIPERGRLAPGYFADVAVFDEKTIAERATYEEPERLAIGMKYVIVNGKLALENGKYTGALAGRALRSGERRKTE